MYSTEVEPAASRFGHGYNCPAYFLGHAPWILQQFEDAAHGNSRSGQACRVEYLWVAPYDILKTQVAIALPPPKAIVGVGTHSKIDSSKLCSHIETQTP
jgi:hypothetical protein